MKKSELLKLLETIEGDPEIVVWNGFVEDYQPIENKLTTVQLAKLSFESYEKLCNAERKLINRPLLTTEQYREKYNNTSQWEIANPEYQLDNEKYDVQTVVMIEPSERKLTCHQRLGKICY